MDMIIGLPIDTVYGFFYVNLIIVIVGNCVG